MANNDTVTALQEKISKFEKTLSADELLRLVQLRSTDEKGNILICEESIKEAERRIAGRPDMPNEVKLAIQASLDSKLQQFQRDLTDAELASLLCQLSTKPTKVQSSFGVCD